jgi:hypothetical protein
VGYSTDFTGQFDLDKPLLDEHAAYLKAFNGTRRMKRNPELTAKLPDPVRVAAGLPLGPDAGYFVGAALIQEEGPFGGAGQAHTADIVDYNLPPDSQPSLWCQWVPDDWNAAIEWDGSQKFHRYVEWLGYLIDHFLAPWGYVLSGTVEWRGEDLDDHGRILVADNVVRTQHAETTWVDD